MRASPQEQVDSAGIKRVMADFADLNWGPQENAKHDLGIDLYLQVRDDRRFDRLALVMAQVKSGESWFDEPVTDGAGTITGWWYREPDAQHFGDWVQHGMPHLLVLHDPRTRTSYWTHVTKDAVTSTGDGFKILIPSIQRIDEANRDALLDVAASGKGNPALQHTSFKAGARAVAPGRALRHALLAPRLIAPHPNRGHKDVLEPEEAVALVTQGRVTDLDYFTDNDLNPKVLGAANSRDWRWRFFAAYQSFVTTGQPSELVDLAAAARRSEKVRAKHAFISAACHVAAVVALADSERWDEAHAVITAVGNDLSPVDRAWVQVHHAVVLAELGDVDAARRLAAKAQQMLALDSDDVTALAIADAAVGLIFETSDWKDRDLRSMLNARDTAVSWWRSQAVSWALSEHDNAAFKAWASGDDPDAQYATDTQNRLLGVWLSTALAGARGAAAAPLAIRAYHELVHAEVTWRENVATAAAHESAAPPTQDSEAMTRPLSAMPPETALTNSLDDLRRYGMDTSLKIAASRLWATGPAASVRSALERSVDATWTHRNALATLTFLAEAGDLLTEAYADRVATRCLAALDDATAFTERVRPTFSISHFMHGALRRLLPAAGDHVHRATVTHLLDLLHRGEPAAREYELLPLMRAVRTSAVAADKDPLFAIASDKPSGRLSAAILEALLRAGDPRAESLLMARADEGDRDAIARLGTASALSKTAAAKLIARESDACRELVAQAHKGYHAFGGGWDSARALTVANLTFPTLASWQPVIDVLLDSAVAEVDKADTVTVLSLRADDLPDNVASALGDALTAAPDALRGLHDFQDPAAFTARVSALALALGVTDAAVALRRVLAWLRGSAAQRRAAADLLMMFGRRTQDPMIQGALVMLTGDSHSRIRAAAAASLARGAGAETPASVGEAILAATTEAGCRVPRAVGDALRSSSSDWPQRTVVHDAISRHVSAIVRATITPEQP